MAKGINTDFKKAIFDVEPTALLELYTIYYDYQNDSQAQINFHGGTNGVNSKIIFDGQEYLPLPIESEGFEILGDQRLPRPKLRISNAGLYVSSLLRKYDNLNNAKVIRKRTFARFLDNANFPGNVNPWGSANPNARMPDDKYFISRKVSENKLAVEFELVTSLELENIDIPARKVSSRYCPWVYRGYGCRYGYNKTTAGADRPIANVDDLLFVTGSNNKWNLNEDVGFPKLKNGSTVQDKSTVAACYNTRGFWDGKGGTTTSNYNVGDYVFTLSPRATGGQGLTANYYQQHPVYYMCKKDNTAKELHPSVASDNWVRDACSKKLGGCQHRFANEEYTSDGGDTINQGKPLPYGGFPGTEKYNY